MASKFLTLMRSSQRLLCSGGIKITQNINSPLIFRTLYCPTTLGLDVFSSQQQQTRNSMKETAERFRNQMLKYVEDEKSMVITDDLKNMIHLSESDEDIDTIVKLIKKFNQQNKQMRFGSFVFGPVVMRLFYSMNKVDEAVECFKAPEMDGFFDQIITYQILLDLLFENQKYDDMLSIFEVIKNRQLDGLKHPKNVIVLIMAACYKQNTPESLKYALELWETLAKSGHLPMRRAATFCAGLALNQGNPSAALEILSVVKKSSYTTVRNIKVACLSDLGRIEDAIFLLKSIINEDVSYRVPHTFNKDVLERVQKVVEKLENPDISLEFNKLYQLFQKQGHISNLTLDEQLCSEIKKPPVMNNRQQNRFSRYQKDLRSPDRYQDERHSRFSSRRYSGLDTD